MPNNLLSLTNNYPLEPKRQNLFTLHLLHVPGNDDITTDKMKIDLISATRPTYEHGVNELNRFNMKYKVAQAPTMGHTLAVVFRDTVQQNLGRAMYLWNKIVFNRNNGAMGYASAYKTAGNLNIYDPRGVLIEKWILDGLFPTTTNWGELTYGVGEALTVTVTFAYDLARLDENVTTENRPTTQDNRDGSNTPEFGGAYADDSELQLADL